MNADKISHRKQAFRDLLQDYAHITRRIMRMIVNSDGSTIASAVWPLIALFAAGACENLFVDGTWKPVAFILIRSTTCKYEGQRQDKQVNIC